MELYLQKIVNSIQMQSLEPDWLSFDLAKFSNKKTLFDYQQKVLENALKALYKYYKDCNGNKESFFELYKNNGLIETKGLDYKLNGKNHKIFKILEEYYEIQNSTIPFYNFINRMSFWMATGSGKTLVIIKLIELLGNLIKNGQIPQKEILFLTYREDLIDQFKKHVNEFNSSDNSLHIILYSLKDYEKVKRENKLKMGNEIDVFYYRSDLISDEQKEKIIDFRNYDANGNWYIILDEAHKGDKEDSKRQLYYSILSRNGFLFNFSATFTDPRDFATCVFNFNLEKFIQSGYGKQVYISQSNIEALQKHTELTERQKQVIILKIFLLHTLIKKSKPQGFYHKPLILTLVNSVNTEDSDLELFFRELVKIAKDGVDDDLLQEAKRDLINDLQHTCEFVPDRIQFEDEQINNLTFEDILENVFNAKTNGDIEVLKKQKDNKQISFKLKTSEKPFALIRIGDTYKWIKDKLSGYEINETLVDESVFEKINKEDSDINILMGSRAFYEGWDSNRPNIILYINIGKGTDAKKFVLQSIGRGVRIEPLPNKRKRLEVLYNNNEIKKNMFEEIKKNNNINLIETLFVYGTKAENLKEVIETLKEQKQEELIGNLFEINPDIKDKLLLIPVYTESEKMLVDEQYFIKFEISKDDLKLTMNYLNYIDDKVALVKFDMEPKILKKIKESFRNQDEYYNTNKNVSTIAKPEILLRNISRHFSIRTKEFRELKPLENEIIHFKQVRISKEKLNSIREKIIKVKAYPLKGEKEKELKEQLHKREIDIDKYTEEIRNIDKNFIKEVEHGPLAINYIQNHYYIPVLLSEDEKINYITHIIKTRSEVDFIKELEEYLKTRNNFFEQFDWWFFSKIDENLDEVYIPYYQPKTNKIEKFKPDFIFWLKKGNRYIILFVDPKSTEYAEGYRKIDGYSRIFEYKEGENKICKTFRYNEYLVSVKLFLRTENMEKVLDKYKEYWFDSFYRFAQLLEALFKNS